MIADFDMKPLCGQLERLDQEWASLHAAMENCPDPDQFGYYDRAEYLAGFAFVACQRYITATYPYAHMKKKDALSLPPTHPTGATFVALIDAAANYWKHFPEWKTRPEAKHVSTVRTIESCGVAVEGYVCCNILFLLVGVKPSPFSRLLKNLVDWRSSIVRIRQERNSPSM